MKLTFEEIKNITFGAVRVWEENDGMHFAKCTEKQEAAWHALSETLGKRAESTTGVRLDFCTDAEALRFSFSKGTKVEVLLDGLFRAQLSMKELRAEGKAAEIMLTDALGAPQKETRVTLAFPYHDTPGVLESLELVNATYCKPHRHDTKILFIGDSITQGWAAMCNTFSYAWRVSLHFNANSVIQGVGGGYFHETTFDHLPFDPDIVVVAYGTNDWGHYQTLSELHEHAGAFLDRIAAEYGDKKIFCISPIWRDLSYTDPAKKPMGSFSECRAAVIEEIEKRGFIHVDGLGLVPPMNEFYYDEYLHPNNEGFSHYAENLIIEMRKHL